MTFQLLHSFESPPDGPWAGLVKAGDGNFYGVTDSGGAEWAGAVFRISPAGTLTIIHQMRSADGSGSEGKLAVGADGYLYGNTYFGGPADAGSIFRVSTNGDFTTLAYFATTNGAHPQTGMVQAGDGSFYGTTYYGGAYGQGVVYRMTPVGYLELVFSFAGSAGAKPSAELCLATDGNLYGTTRFGGTNGQGTVFRLDVGSGTVSTLVHLGAAGGPLYPTTGVIQATNGSLYGATSWGGDYNRGAVYQVDLAGNLTTLASFDGTNSWGAESTMIQGSDGNFYGTSSSQVYKVTPQGIISTLFEFPRDMGSDLEGDLVEGDDGNFYGTTYWGGLGNRGIIYRISPTGNVQTLASFVAPGGSAPEGRLAQGADGNLYGTTVEDGAFGAGTAFRLTPAGVLTTLYHFDNTNGGYPDVLISGNNGNLYGTTESGGLWDDGTVFRLTTNGTVTLLASLDGTNGDQPQSLLQANDGNLYGTTLFGGPADDGVIFKVATNGVFTMLHGSQIGTGNYPEWPIQALDGNLYGTAYNGPFQGGVVWSLTLNGDYSVAHAFNRTTGDSPGAGLAQDAAGVIYGTMGGGTHPLFALATNGAIRTVGSIPDDDPRGILLGPDGNFYGTTWLGGPGGEGTVWVMNRNGRSARLVSFDDSNGGSLRSGPLLGSDGRLYGTTEWGGPGGGGVIYALSFSIPEIIAQPLPQSILPGGSAVFDVIVFSTHSVTYQWRRNGVDIPGTTSATFSVTNAQPGDATNYSVAITSAGTTVLSSNALLALLPPNPTLAISRSETNIVLSWPAGYTGFNLEQCSNLAPTNWTPVVQTPASNSGQMSVSLPISSGAFYRLRALSP